FFQAEDGIRDFHVTGVQTCALPICDLIKDIDCDPQDGGHLYVAHKPKMMQKLEAESRLLNETFGYGTRILSREEVWRDFMRDERSEERRVGKECSSRGRRGQETGSA